MSGFSTPNHSPNGAVKTPDTVIDNGSPTNQQYPNLEDINEELQRENRRLQIENRRLKQELRNCLPKHGQTPSTVLVVRRSGYTEQEYYTWELVPYTTEHRDKGLAVFDANGNKLAKSVNMDNELSYDFDAEQPQIKRQRTEAKRGGKKCITRYMDQVLKKSIHRN